MNVTKQEPGERHAQVCQERFIEPAGAGRRPISDQEGAVQEIDTCWGWQVLGFEGNQKPPHGDRSDLRGGCGHGQGSVNRILLCCVGEGRRVSEKRRATATGALRRVVAMGWNVLGSTRLTLVTMLLRAPGSTLGICGCKLLLRCRYSGSSGKARSRAERPLEHENGHHRNCSTSVDSHLPRPK